MDTPHARLNLTPPRADASAPAPNRSLLNGFWKFSGSPWATVLVLGAIIPIARSGFQDVESGCLPGNPWIPVGAVIQTEAGLRVIDQEKLRDDDHYLASVWYAYRQRERSEDGLWNVAETEGVIVSGALDATETADARAQYINLLRAHPDVTCRNVAARINSRDARSVVLNPVSIARLAVWVLAIPFFRSLTWTVDPLVRAAKSVAGQYETPQQTAERRRREALAESLCPQCGYSLVGLLSRTCPECGESLERS